MNPTPQSIKLAQLRARTNRELVCLAEQQIRRALAHAGAGGALDEAEAAFRTAKALVAAIDASCRDVAPLSRALAGLRLTLDQISHPEWKKMSACG